MAVLPKVLIFSRYFRGENDVLKCSWLLAPMLTFQPLTCVTDLILEKGIVNTLKGYFLIACFHFIKLD